ncbi:hypothetical protein IQ273_18590 [Nodosilinea sp. LEGE 07298]|uniref:hypothetical protein n=1 Tax=Nodosilinea sp. LEGE 07298 TaxID=2777970 RepID=UPI00187E1E39|nr:hypothetical protein [Nodosilinea sp. LEGE 07298]MBE9111416.1 hypothetical protein [Nodosilinea sp. LEGE 07298]
MTDSTNTRIDTADILAIDAAVSRSSGSAQFGITQDGFIAKPFARLLAEKLALARELFGNDLDLSSGSAIRKLLEVSALEDARTWAALTSMYDNNFVSTATGEALSCLGEELGIGRPFLEAKGKIRLTLVETLPDGITQLSIPRGARLLTLGGHHVATNESVVISAANPERDVAVVAFYPGSEHNLNPSRAAADSTFPEKIDRWHRNDPMLNSLFEAEQLAGTPLIQISHTISLSGGELQWDDNRYRQLLLQAPRSLWTVEAIQTAVSLIPGVRQVQVRDSLGGIDLSQAIFGTFNFMDRLFSSERDLAKPYSFTVLVGPTPAAIWDGPDGLEIAIQSAIEDLRPISIFPKIIKAVEVGIGVKAQLVVRGLPLPTGSRDVINNSTSAGALKQRLIARLQGYIDSLSFGEPVRASEIIWALMSEPGIVDVVDLKLLRFPPNFDSINLQATPVSSSSSDRYQVFEQGKNISLQSTEIPIFVDDPAQLVIL